MPVYAAGFLDSNILLYTVDPRDPAKQAVATELVRDLSEREGAMVSTQVLIEVFSTLHCKLHVSRERAAVFCYALTDWAVVASDLPLAMKAMARSAQSRRSIWDCMIVEAALAGGAQILYSEDFSPGQSFGRLRVVNPFEPIPA